jgi:hypothetical protein
MNSRLHAIRLAVVVAAASPLIAGCAEDSFEREAAYPPQPVGQTIPPSAPPEQVADTEPPAPPPPPPSPPPPRRAPVTIGVDQAPAGSMPADEAGGQDDGYADTDPSALQDFRGALSPYGSWVDDPTYGTVWVPSTSVVGNDFTPYVTDGRWAYDDQSDYTWVSDYDWGWAPFHYGRWVNIDGRGWGWIPGRRYAPAWVTWRVGAPGFGFVGWSPMVPTWGWRGGAVMSFGFAVGPRWNYCGTGDLFAGRGLAGHILSGPRVGEAEGGTRPWEGEGGRHGGPPPSRVGIPPEKVPHPAPNDPGIAHAKGFGHPSTSGPLGGHAPARLGPNREHAGEAVLPNHAPPENHGGAAPENHGGAPPENHGGAPPKGGGKEPAKHH